MTFLTKSFHFIVGVLLYLFYSKKLDFTSLLKNKRVAIVGAANSAYQTGKGSYLDGFDYVIRINKAPHLVHANTWAEDIGTRTDILFHSFFENEQSGGGKLDMAIYDKQGIKFIINPIAAYAGYRVTFNFYKKYLVSRKTYSLDKKWFQELETKLDGFRPTIGFCALSAVLRADFSELYITGFTFFKTAFGEGYRDHMKDSDSVRSFIKDAGIHNPDKEFEVFCTILRSNINKNVVLDPTLKAIVIQHNPDARG
jgi:hypothetical protein